MSPPAIDHAGPTGTSPGTSPWWIFSADDHLFERDDTFASRVPKRLRDQAPRIVDLDGGDAWLMEGVPIRISGAEGFASFPPEDQPFLRDRLAAGGAGSLAWQPADGELPPPPRTAAERIKRGFVRVLEDWGPGVTDVDGRIAAMDRDGVWASVLIPSVTFGFAGQRLSMFKDAEAGLAFVRAYNDWLHEYFALAQPERLVCSAVPWLCDPIVAAAEVRRNAERGFKATLFPENPERFGFPSIHNEAWTPFFAACEETDTVVNVHLGTGLKPTSPSSDSPPPVVIATICTNPPITAFDWIFSGIPQRFPRLRIAFTEGGIDWVPTVIARLETFDQHTLEGYWQGELSPSEILFRNFWFAALTDVGAYQFLADRCPDHVLIETDFPHADSAWPRSRSHFEKRLAGLSPDIRDKYLVSNACALYRHPLPNRPASSVATA